MKYICYGVRGSRPTPFTRDQMVCMISQFLVNAGSERLVKYSELSNCISDLSIPTLQMKSKFNELLKSVDKGLNLYRIPLMNTGRNTPCVEIRSNTPKKDQILFDLGTGAVNIEILKETKALHIFFSHFHYDHVQGMLFCKSLYNKNMTVHFYSPVIGFEKYLHELMNHPYFPVTMSESMTSQMYFHDLSNKRNIRINDMTITWKEINHPGGSYAYKVANRKEKFCYFTDVSIGDSLFKKTKENIEFLTDIDTMILDAAMAFEDSIIKKYWGHTSFYTGIDFAKLWEVKNLYLFHTDPADDITTLPALYQCALWYNKSINSPVSVRLAEEGKWDSV